MFKINTKKLSSVSKIEMNIADVGHCGTGDPELEIRNDEGLKRQRNAYRWNLRALKELSNMIFIVMKRYMWHNIYIEIKRNIGT